MKVLSIAEKPSVAKELAAIIGRGAARSRNGYSNFNRIFEVDHCDVQGQQCSMHITSVVGHLMQIEFDAKYMKWNSCSPEELFTAPIKKFVNPELMNIQRTLKEEARWCNTLLLWLDCDLEGENIAFEVITVCKEANPRLRVLRARFSALIPRDIFRAMNQPDQPNERMSNAVDARMEIDLRLGAIFTRFQTLRLQKKFVELKADLLSYGPCQFPTLGFVVERFLQIKNFVSEDFWGISCELETLDPDEKSGMLLTKFSWARGRLYDKLACVLLYDICVEGGVATVIDSHSRPTTRQRPVPLNTIELQKRASRFLRMSSEETMSVAEKLYQQGILSYPRTETDMFKEGTELLQLLGEHREHPLWGGFVSNMLDNAGFSWPRDGGHDDQAHPPIHPTKSVSLDALDNDKERNLYELVTRHFIACCSQDARGSQTTIKVRVPFEGGEVFQATGLMVLERNWLDVYQRWEKWVGNKVAALAIGDTFTPKRMDLTEGRTGPPPLLSESDLIAEMDRNGIGTDATIAQHISTIQVRNYAYKDEQLRFVPTERGIGLVEGYNTMGYQLNKPFLRSSMELDCQRITRGELTKEEMVRNCLEQMKVCYQTCVREGNKLDEAMAKYFQGIGQGPQDMYELIQSAFSGCGKCGQAMDLRGLIENGQRGQTRFLYCTRCEKGLDMPRNGVLSATAQECPLCAYEVVSVVNEVTEKTHTVCPQCFSEPPPPPYSVEGFSGEFRCFMCAHPACQFAQRKEAEVPAGPCYETGCTGELRVKKVVKNKSFVMGCSMYPSCKASWWLPKAVMAAVSGDKGPVRLLALTLNLTMAPPGCPPECVACPCCSDIWSRFDVNPLPCARGSRPGAGGRAGLGRGDQGRVGGTLNGSVQADISVRGSGGTNYSAAAAGIDQRRVTGHGRGPGGGGAMLRTAPTNPSAGMTAAGTNVDMNAPPCRCGEISVQRTVTKPGDNNGRKFFCCAKPREEQCGYFEWSNGGIGSGAVGASAGTAIICSRCKQAGHYARSCPIAAPTAASGRGSSAGRGGKAVSVERGHGGSDPSMVTCSRCKQTGHFARSCPNK